MVMKLFNKVITICMAALCCHACFDEFINDIDHPYIRFVNQSDDTVWVEMLNPREITFNFKGTINDSLFYGVENIVLPNSTKQINSYYSPYWGGDIRGNVYVEKDTAYIARVFVMDSCTPTRIWYAREKYYHGDSLQVIQTLKKFEQNHLLYKHWFSKEELDCLNWTIVYP